MVSQATPSCRDFARWIPVVRKTLDVSEHKIIKIHSFSVPSSDAMKILLVKLMLNALWKYPGLPIATIVRR